MRGGWAHNRNVSSKLFVTGFNDYEFDDFQSLDLRVDFPARMELAFFVGRHGDATKNGNATAG